MRAPEKDRGARGSMRAPEKDRGGGWIYSLEGETETRIATLLEEAASRDRAERMVHR